MTDHPRWQDVRSAIESAKDLSKALMTDEVDRRDIEIRRLTDLCRRKQGRIDELEAEVERLREALPPGAEGCTDHDLKEIGKFAEYLGCKDEQVTKIRGQDARIAELEAALASTQNGHGELMRAIKTVLGYDVWPKIDGPVRPAVIQMLNEWADRHWQRIAKLEARNRQLLACIRVYEPEYADD